MDATSEADHKRLYCHWDTHVNDVLFNNEAELDQHIYEHFLQSSEDPRYLAPTPASPVAQGVSGPLEPSAPAGETIECHWDACHEMFEIDQIMQHLRESHMQDSLHPHLEGCDTTHHCELPSPNSELDTKPAFVRLNTADTSLLTPPVFGSAPLETSSLPQLQAPLLPAAPTANGGDYVCQWMHPGGECCGKQFLTSPELHAHIVHGHIKQGPASQCVCRWKGCERQHKPFAQRQKLVRHQQIHAKTFDYKCRICGRALSCESMRRAHERSHTNERPYKCEICGSRFRASASLMVHQRTHTGEKPLACKFPGCDKRFAESSNLAKHMRTHQEKAFKCERCERRFTRKDHLLRHRRSRCGQGGSEQQSGSLASSAHAVAPPPSQDAPAHPAPGLPAIGHLPVSLNPAMPFIYNAPNPTEL